MTYRFRLATESVNPAVSHHRLLRGLPGYLILFDPHAFVPQRQCVPGRLPSQSAFCELSKHFTATLRIPPPSSRLKTCSSRGTSGVEHQAFTTGLQTRLRTL